MPGRYTQYQYPRLLYHMIRLYKSTSLVAVIVLLVLVSLNLNLHPRRGYGYDYGYDYKYGFLDSGGADYRFKTTTFKDNDYPIRYRNIAVASDFGAHFDVYMALVWTLERVALQQQVNITITVYTPSKFGRGFQDIVHEYGLFHGRYKNRDELLKDVAAEGEGEGRTPVDMVVFGTCEIDMKRWKEDLLSIWDARDNDNKFQVVCIVHNAGDKKWQSVIPEWSRRNAFRVLPISEHITKTFRGMFLDSARSADLGLRSAGMEYIRVDTHVPILDVRNLPDSPDQSLNLHNLPSNLPDRPTRNRTLANAVIQGSFQLGRRDYNRIFEQLERSLMLNPSSWGYLPLLTGVEVNTTTNKTSFITDPTSPHPPFKLHLIGSGPKLPVPPSLTNIVVFHTDLNYRDFYALMGTMDVCIPAFLSTSDGNYKYQASSSVGMCLECEVPILALRQLREAYTYIDDDRVTITHPASMNEMEAIEALRTGDASDFLDMDMELSATFSSSSASAFSFTSNSNSDFAFKIGDHPEIRTDVERMIKAGWERPKKGYYERKREVWAANEVIVNKVLRDL